MKITIKYIVGAIALLSVFRSMGQTNILITNPVVALDQTVKIKWNSQPGTVYQVWAADSLTGTNAQGLQWTIREADCASKGTNAEWMDVGDPLWTPRIVPPRFQPQRFYRVQKVKQATMTPPPTVSVQLSQTNVASGDLYATVNVTLIDTNQQMSDVRVFVDGQKFYSSGNQNFTVFINSCEWPNGPHEIYAVATVVNEGETLPDNDGQTATNAAIFAVGVSPSKFITFSNYISQFFVATPFFDPTVGETQQILATFPENTCWRLTVLDYQDNPVRQFTNQSPNLYVSWNGNDGSGNPLPFGFYDYYIEARPAQFGCPSGEGPFSMAVMSRASALSVAGAGSGVPSEATAKAGVFSRAAMQFTRRTPATPETVTTPDLNPAAVPVAAVEAAVPRVLTYKVAADGTTNEYINGVPAFLYPPETPVQRTRPARLGSDASASSGAFAAAPDGANGPQPADFPDGVYTTRTPNRIPGNMFMGKAGSMGIAYQGDHPTSPSFAIPAGGIVSLSHPPYGPLTSASKIVNNFINVMGASAWKTAFNLGDDNLNSSNLAPILGPNTGTSDFARKCNFGLYVGHMTATSGLDPNFQCQHSWIPIYDSYYPVPAYQWVPMPGIDLGPPNGASPLFWMAFYGCDSMRSLDWNDMWTKFLLPFPPNIRLLLGAEDGVFIHPIFGWQFAADMNGLTTSNNVPMTIVESWYDAARVADQQTAKSPRYGPTMGTRRMTAVYRDITQGGTWKTINDTIWSWGTDISYDWFDVSLDERTVYP
jgi:hypothetical protein